MNQLSFFQYYVARRIANQRDREGKPPIKAAQILVGISGLCVLGMFTVAAIAIVCTVFGINPG